VAAAATNVVTREYSLPLSQQFRGSGKVRACANLSLNLAWYQLYDNLTKGGKRIHRPPEATLDPLTGGELRDGSYLRRLPMEVSDAKADAFALRRDRSYSIPICRRIVDTYVNVFARQQVDRTRPRDVLTPQYMANIDLRGSSAEEFILRAWRKALQFGWIGVLTDMPRIEKGRYASALHEKMAGVRPYSRILLPYRFWDWERDRVTGEFLYALIYEGAVPSPWSDTGRPSLPSNEASLQRFRAWSPDGWVLITGEGREIDSGEHSFGRVPIDILVCDESDDDYDATEPPGVSALADVALIALEMHQAASLLGDAHRKALFSFLHLNPDGDFEADTKPAADMSVGYDYWLNFRGEAHWVDPPVSVLLEGRAYIDWLEAEARKGAGVARRSEDSIESHSGKALEFEYMPLFDVVRDRAGRLQDFENRFWRTVAELKGANVDALGDEPVQYPTDFVTTPVRQSLAEAKAVTDVYGSYEEAPMYAQHLVDVNMGRAAQRMVGHLEEGKQIAEEVEAHIATDSDEPTEEMAEPVEGDDVTSPEMAE